MSIQIETKDGKRKSFDKGAEVQDWYEKNKLARITPKKKRKKKRSERRTKQI